MSRKGRPRGGCLERKLKRQTLLLLVGLTVLGSSAFGQAAPRGPTASVLFRDVARGPLSVNWSAEPRDSVVRDIRPTYWKEGALVGGLVGAISGALLAAAFCENPGCGTVPGAIGGAVLLAIPGALIGGQFRKGS